MAGPYGVTLQGFVRPRLVDIQKDLNDSLINTFGATTNTAARSVFGQISGIVAERLDLLWQGLEDDYDSKYRDTAFGASLDGVGSNSGIPRLEPLASTVINVKLFGTAGTPIPSTAQFSVQGSPTNVFNLNAPVTLLAGQNCVQRVAFSAVPTVGQWQWSLNGHQTTLLAFNANAAAFQAAIHALPPMAFCSGCTVTGDYTAGFTINFLGEGTGGLMVQPQALISVNTLAAGMTAIVVTPSTMVAGIDQANVAVTATGTGPKLANAATLINIVTPLTGLDAVLNIVDAVQGRDLESDNAYRFRQEQELQIAGAGTVEAIRSRLLSVLNVTAVIVFENFTEIYDVNGRPPKSFEAVVEGGTDADIANMLWKVKPAGIRPDGSTAYTILDSMGLSHVMRFSRPTLLPVYLSPQITTDGNYPVNGDELVAQALVTAGNLLGIGKEVVLSPYLMSVLAAIPGIQNVELFAGTAPNPGTDNNILVAPNEVATFDTSRVNTVHV